MLSGATNSTYVKFILCSCSCAVILSSFRTVTHADTALTANISLKIAKPVYFDRASHDSLKAQRFTVHTLSGQFYIFHTNDTNLF